MSVSMSVWKGSLAFVSGLLIAIGCAGGNASPPIDDSSGAGWVIVEFEVDTEGATRNIQIVESHPPGEFDSAMIEAVAKWRYKPAMRDGKAVSSKQRVRYVFAEASNDPKCPKDALPTTVVGEDLWQIEATQPVLPLPEPPKD